MNPEFLQLIQMPLHVHVFEHDFSLVEILQGLDAVRSFIGTKNSRDLSSTRSGSTMWNSL
jgi:hypothetical protein